MRRTGRQRRLRWTLPALSGRPASPRWSSGAFLPGKNRRTSSFSALRRPGTGRSGRCRSFRRQSPRRGCLPARSLCHDARQQLLQLFRRLLREHPPGRAMCQRCELFARRLVHGTLHEKRGVIDASRRNGVHHPGHLQRRLRSSPVPKQKLANCPSFSSVSASGRTPEADRRPSCNVLSLPEAQRCRHLPDARPQFPPQLDKVAVAALFQSAVQPHETVRYASGTAVELAVQGVVAGTLPDEVPLLRLPAPLRPAPV